MILYVNSKGEVKAVNSTEDKSLTELPISENSMNPFSNWPIAKICCYRVGVIPEMVTEVVGTEDRTYTDLDGNEVTETVDITETRETGKYIISMMTPYMDSRIVEHIAKLGNRDDVIASDVTTTQVGLIENYDQTMTLAGELLDTQLGLIENYDLAMATGEEVAAAKQEITDCQVALVEIYSMLETIGGGM